MSVMAFEIASLTIVYSSIYSGTDERKHQSSASIPFVMGIHRRPVNSPYKGPITRKIFPFDDVIMTKHSFDPFLIRNHFSFTTRRQGPVVYDVFLIASIYFEVLMTYKYIESTVLRQDENTPVEVLSLLYCKYDIMFNLLIKCHYRNDFVFYFVLMWRHIDGLVQERRNSSALAMELRLSCTKPLTCVVCNTSTDHASLTVPERKFVTKIRLRYHDPRWRRQQPVRMFTPRLYPGSDG